MKQIHTSEEFDTFNHSSIFNKAVFGLGEKQGTCTFMLVNNECTCSSWYNKVGDS